MSVPGQILMLAAAGVLWGLGRAVAPAPAPAPRNLFGLAGSPYGELVARLLRPGMDGFWHLGRPAHDGAAAPPEAAPAGPAARLQALKKAIGAPNTPVPPSAGLRRFAAASADRRLRRALQLAPADWVLLDIFLYSQVERLESEPSRRARLDAVAAAAIARGLRSEATLSEALAGAGAASLLLELASPDEPGEAPSATAAAEATAVAALDDCLQRYRERHQEFLDRGWWDGIPEIRRDEFTRQVELLEALARSRREKNTATPPPAAD